MHNTGLQCVFQQIFQYFYCIYNGKDGIYIHTQIVPGLDLSVLLAQKTQWNMAQKQLGWWCYVGVHIVWWVGHPSGRLQLPKAVSSSAAPGPTAAHTHTLNLLQLYTGLHRQTCTVLAETYAHTYRREEDNIIAKYKKTLSLKT